MDSSEAPTGRSEPAESAARRAGAAAGTGNTAATGSAAATGTVTGTGAVAETGTVAVTGPVAETRGARFARKAHRTRLYFYAGAAIVLLVFLIALVLANTGHVKVSWVFGSSSVSLVWLVLGSAILGLLLGMVLGALFHWRTRRPRD